MSITHVDSNLCTGCSACAAVCPKRCIQLEQNEEGFVYPKVDQSLCVECGLCEKVCPALEGQLEQSRVQQVFYGWHREDSVRLASSSGGVYSGLAQRVLEQGGRVFGSVFDPEKRRAVHSSSEQGDYALQRKSKYVESALEDTFRQAKSALESGVPVLFSGAPCQIYGLYNYLGKEYPNLVTCDFICGGVNSNRVFQDYLDGLERRYGAKVKNVDFRSKKYGWSTHSIRVELQNGRQYNSHYYTDPFFHGFFDHCFLRKCCYQCRFKNAHRADITLADYWRYRDVEGLRNDELGISLVSANSRAAAEWLQGCAALQLTEISPEHAAYNYRPAELDQNALRRREQFFSLYQREGFSTAAKKTYLKKTGIFRLKFWLKRKLGR